MLLIITLKLEFKFALTSIELAYDQQHSSCAIPLFSIVWLFQSLDCGYTGAPLVSFAEPLGYGGHKFIKQFINYKETVSIYQIQLYSIGLPGAITENTCFSCCTLKLRTKRHGCKVGFLTTQLQVFRMTLSKDNEV